MQIPQSVNVEAPTSAIMRLPGPDTQHPSPSGTLPCTHIDKRMPILANLANLSIVPGAVLLLPTAATLWFRWAALRADEAKQKVIWAGFRKFGRFILAVTVAVWWV